MRMSITGLVRVNVLREIKLFVNTVFQVMDFGILGARTIPISVHRNFETFQTFYKIVFKIVAMIRRNNIWPIISCSDYVVQHIRRSRTSFRKMSARIIGYGLSRGKG